jgi:hypothetical protein
VLLCQFSVLAGNRFWFYILLMYLGYHTVVVLCYFFWFWQEIVFGVTYNTVVRLCQFFCCGGKVNFVQTPYSHDRFSKISRTFFVIKLIPSLSCFVWIYNHSVMIVSQKISRTLFDFINNTYLFSLF